jgi:hypothetical protein
VGWLLWSTCCLTLSELGERLLEPEGLVRGIQLLRQGHHAPGEQEENQTLDRLCHTTSAELHLCGDNGERALVTLLEPEERRDAPGRLGRDGAGHVHQLDDIAGHQEIEGVPSRPAAVLGLLGVTL